MSWTQVNIENFSLNRDSDIEKLYRHWKKTPTYKAFILLFLQIENRNYIHAFSLSYGALYFEDTRETNPSRKIRMKSWLKKIKLQKLSGQEHVTN